MLDIKEIRKNPNFIKEQLGHRGIPAKDIDDLLDIDRMYRQLISKNERLKSIRNQRSTEISNKKRNNLNTAVEINEVRQINDEIRKQDEKIQHLNEKLTQKMSNLPNIPNSKVPVSLTEDGAKELRRIGTPRKFNFTPKAHWELGKNLGIFDFERGVKVSGSRFLYYLGDGAKLERAVYNFFLDEHEKEGYQEILPPYLVTNESMYGTGQFPKFENDAFQIKNQDLTLIPTAEVPLINYYRDEIIPEEKLPINFTALTPSFREEVGSAGRDTKGLIRLHQFNKVEMVKFVKPEDSWNELEQLTSDAESLLKKLGLPYRVITLTTSDMSFTAAMTHDLEIWFPQQNRYREVSSCSNCTDFQARRAHIQYRDKTGKLHYVHTLNGSGLAVGRTIAAIMENYQNEDGTITVPDVLVPYMNGKTIIKMQSQQNNY